MTKKSSVYIPVLAALLYISAILPALSVTPAYAAQQDEEECISLEELAQLQRAFDVRGCALDNFGYEWHLRFTGTMRSYAISGEVHIPWSANPWTVDGSGS